MRRPRNAPLPDAEFEAINQIIANERLLPHLVLDTLISHRSQFFTGTSEELSIKIKWLVKIYDQNTKRFRRIVRLKWRTRWNIWSLREKQRRHEAAEQQWQEVWAAFQKVLKEIQTKNVN